MKFQQSRCKGAYTNNCYSCCTYANNRPSLLKLDLCNGLVLIWLSLIKMRVILEKNRFNRDHNVQLWILYSSSVVFKVLFFICGLDWILKFSDGSVWLQPSELVFHFFFHPVPWNYWELKLFFFPEPWKLQTIARQRDVNLGEIVTTAHAWTISVLMYCVRALLSTWWHHQRL